MERSLIERVRREVQEVVNVLKKVTITPAMRTELEHAGAEENIGPLESALEFYKHVREPNVVARLTPESAAAEGHARNVRTRAYEHIYSVRYDDVPPAWRILYSVSSFALVHVFVEQQRPLSAIHTLDLALMMGHPDLSDIAHQLMKIVQRLRREADERESNEENGSSGASGRPQQGKGNSSARGGRGGNADDDDEDEDDEDDEEDGEAGGNDDDHEDETSGGADDTDGGASGGTSSGGDRRGRRGGGGGGGRGGGGRGGGGGGGRGRKRQRAPSRGKQRTASLLRRWESRLAAATDAERHARPAPITVLANPSPAVFWKTCIEPHRPCLLRNMCTGWPCMEKWRDLSYLLDIAGDRLVPVEIGERYTDDEWRQELMSFREFVERYLVSDHGEIGYLAQHELLEQIRPLRNDIQVPDICMVEDQDLRKRLCAEHTKRFRDHSSPDLDRIAVNTWIGPQGTKSPLHHDPKNNVLVQVVGRKSIRLFDETETPKLYPFPEEDMMSNTSQVDCSHPDLEKFPLYAEATSTVVSLSAGDALFMPARMWHYVESQSPSVSLSFWFA